MDTTHPPPRIINSDRLDSGIVVSFEDGRSALYSAELLYTNLANARAMPSNSGEELAVNK
jgi:hypothetical protein